MKITKTNYPDGSFYTKIDFEGKSEHDLTFRINSYEDLWQLNQIKDICDHNNVKVNLTIPNILDAQADMRFDDDEPANFKLVCKFINNLNFNSVKVFHPHNPTVTEALINDVKIIDNTEFIKKVLYSIRGNMFQTKGPLYDGQIHNDLILLSTDGGGFKPLMKLCDKIGWQGETESAAKSRKYEEGKSKLIQKLDRQDFGGKDCLIIDDLSVYGGTFLGLAKMLKERNCGKLYLAVSHITVPNPNSDLFKVFDLVFTTNSKGLRYEYTPDDWVEGPKPTPINLITIPLFD